MKRFCIIALLCCLWTVGCWGQKSFKKTVQGSAMYAWYLPWDLDYMYIEKGTWDGFDHTNYRLYHGLDYICQKIVAGDEIGFEYCADDDPLKAGAYIIQFADNYDGQSVTVKLTKNVDAVDSTAIKQCAYYATGDADGRLRSHKEPVYRFNTDTQRFEYYPEGKIISAYEACVVVTVDNPEEYIIPNGSTGIERLKGVQGSVQGLIFNLAGQRVGDDYKGVIIVNGKKYLKQ